MRRFVVGTAGHVDHGKTTLVLALTGVDTDRLPEEKRRGITIELGFARWDLGDGMSASIIDVPGHRRLVHTMIAGAIGMELVILVVAADEGVMPQTREHVAACELLGLRRAVVAVTKVDRVGDEVAQLAGDEALELLGDRFEAEVVLCSGRTKQGLDDVKNAVKRALSSLPAPGAAARARLSVDRVFTVKGSGTVVTGTLVEGRIATGDKLFVVGERGAEASGARGLHVHDSTVELAEAPTRLALNLASMPLEAVHRGDVVTTDGDVSASSVIDCELRALGKIKQRATASLYVGTARAAVRVIAIGKDLAFCRLRLDRPLVVVGGDRFVLRGSDVDGPSGAVLGGGRVIDARPPRGRGRDKRRRVLEAVARGDAAGAATTVLEEAAPRPVAPAALGTRFALPPGALAAAIDKRVTAGEVFKAKSGAWVLRSVVADLARRAQSLVAEHHERAPLDRGLPLETLRKQLGAASGVEAADEAIKLASAPKGPKQGEPIKVDGDVARLASFGGAVAGAVAGALGAAVKAIGDAGLKGVSEFQLKEAAACTPKDAKAILAKLVREGAAVHTGDLWFARGAVDELRAKVVGHLATSGTLTIADFKTMSGLGRKQAIPLLEMLDREGVTRRVGDDRLPGTKLPA